MTTDNPTPPRVRRPGPGGFHVATPGGKGTPWWRLVGDNGEILGHSEVYASIANAARGADDAERTAIRNAHPAGPQMYDALLVLDELSAEPDALPSLAQVFGGQVARALRADPAHTTTRLVQLAALALAHAHVNAGGEL